MGILVPGPFPASIFDCLQSGKEAKRQMGVILQITAQMAVVVAGYTVGPVLIVRI